MSFLGSFKKLFGGTKDQSPADLNSPEEIKAKLDNLMQEHAAKPPQTEGATPQAPVSNTAPAAPSTPSVPNQPSSVPGAQPEPTPSQPQPDPTQQNPQQ